MPTAPTTKPTPPAIAIIGAGFSGVAVATELLQRLPSGSSIHLINASGQLARGLAYGTRSPDHVLNVPTARMSLQATVPEGFLQWLNARPQSGAQKAPFLGHEFVARELYGDYLSSQLAEAQHANPQVRFTHRAAEVIGLQQTENQWQLELNCGQAMQASHVVLALGNFSPSAPHKDFTNLPSRHYVNDPWGPDPLQNMGPDERLLIVGTGLTMLDVLANLRRAGHQGPVLALSRRGLLPQKHRNNELPPAEHKLPPEVLDDRTPLRLRCKHFRRAMANAVATGSDWRDIWVALRPHTPLIWKQLPLRERAQFLRHLQPYWDSHRHRSAPDAWQAMSESIKSGQVAIAAGRIVSAQLDQGRVDVAWRARGQSRLARFSADRIINCTGPSSRIQADRSALLWGLQQQGKLATCPQGLGLLVDEHYCVLDKEGRSQTGLYYIGPLLKAQLWEATAVPELRVHAAALVNSLLTQLGANNKL